ncbi:MAG: lipopolysaccharide heptosyltransferase II [Pseudohongiellaceae bacterium]
MKILVTGPAWVGDMVMAQSLFITLRQLHPQAEIDVLAPDWTRPLLERMPQVHKSIVMPLGHGSLGLGVRWRLGKALAGEAYDQGIVLPNSFKSALVQWFAGIERRTGYRGEARGLLLNDCRRLDRGRYPLMVQRFNALAYPAQTPADEIPLPQPQLQVQADAGRAARQRLGLLDTREVVVFCPGAEFGASKQWPAEYYGATARALIDEGRQIWLLGSEKDRATCRQILHCLSRGQLEHCRDLSGKTSLAEAIDLLADAGSVLTNDSGLMHVAAALNRPMVVIYGSTSPEFTPPLTETARILSLGLECSPCFKRECPLEHHRCMKDLEPALVLAALASAVAELTGKT